MKLMKNCAVTERRERKMNENYWSIYEKMLLETIHKGDVTVTELSKLGSPRSGYSGTVYYHGKEFPFEGEIIADDEPYLHFSVPFSVTIDNRYGEMIVYLMIMTNHLIKGDGVVLHDNHDGIYLSRTVSLVETVTVDYVNDTMKTIYLKKLLMKLSTVFGFNKGCERTLEEVRKELGVTRERVRQIEAKALRKLRHPSRLKYLKGA